MADRVKTKRVLIPLPEELVSQLDVAAKQSERTRSGEIRKRLAESFRPAARTRAGVRS